MWLITLDDVYDRFVESKKIYKYIRFDDYCSLIKKYGGRII